MARVERVRQLERRSDVPVTVIPRDRFARLSRQGDVSRARLAFANPKFVGLFVVDASTNAVAVR